MKVKNYLWTGFGFPVVFSELPAIQLRGEIVPDVDFSQFAKPLIQFICTTQDIPLNGNQVKFIRHALEMSLRDFAKFMNVTHQSVMRWESKENLAARIDVNTEFVLRIKVLKALHSSAASIKAAVDRVDGGEQLEAAADYKKFKPVRVPESVLHTIVL